MRIEMTDRPGDAAPGLGPQGFVKGQYFGWGIPVKQLFKSFFKRDDDFFFFMELFRKGLSQVPQVRLKLAIS